MWRPFDPLQLIALNTFYDRRLICPLVSPMWDPKRRLRTLTPEQSTPALTARRFCSFCHDSHVPPKGTTPETNIGPFTPGDTM
ncbi:hypothetical protein RUM43_012302 [Polyplax serrata]|uniref:Uncharacterized protein n=1 Tax=Polyplax serrata TaxID=468196 RepID=A0AAN8NX09_POLSC